MRLSVGSRFAAYASIATSILAAACASRAHDDPESVSTANEAVGGGANSANASVLYLKVAGGFYGSGVVVAPRCLLTATHVVKDSLPATAIQSLSAGADASIEQTPALPHEDVLRLSMVEDQAPAEGNDPDIAFVWLSNRGNAAPAAPGISSWAPRGLGGAYDLGAPADWDDGDLTTAVGFGTDCLATPAGKKGIQRQADLRPVELSMKTRSAVPKVQLAGLETSVLFAGRMRQVCPGDSGGPHFVGGTAKSLIIGMVARPERGYYLSTGTNLAPYMPWVNNHLATFCKPKGTAGVLSLGTVTANISLTIAGGAFYFGGEPWAPSTIESTTASCSASGSCMKGFRADDPFMGHVTIKTAVTGASGGLCAMWAPSSCDEDTRTGTQLPPFQSTTCTWSYAPSAEDRYDTRVPSFGPCGGGTTGSTTGSTTGATTGGSTGGSTGATTGSTTGGSTGTATGTATGGTTGATTGTATGGTTGATTGTTTGTATGTSTTTTGTSTTTTGMTTGASTGATSTTGMTTGATTGTSTGATTGEIDAGALNACDIGILQGLGLCGLYGTCGTGSCNSCNYCVP